MTGAGAAAAIVVGATATLLHLAGRAALAQPATTVWDGVFTAEQAIRGQSGYQKACGSCHGTGLEGDGFATPLIGEPFTDRWHDGSVGDLLLVVKTTMPQDRPGSLSADAYADIVAYLLKMNNYPAGQRELSQDPDQYKNVRFSRVAEVHRRNVTHASGDSGRSPKRTSHSHAAIVFTFSTQSSPSSQRRKSLNHESTKETKDTKRPGFRRGRSCRPAGRTGSSACSAISAFNVFFVAFEAFVFSW